MTEPITHITTWGRVFTSGARITEHCPTCACETTHVWIDPRPAASTAQCLDCGAVNEI